VRVNHTRQGRCDLARGREGSGVRCRTKSGGIGVVVVLEKISG
jgi:hypothetical protein